MNKQHDECYGREPSLCTFIYNIIYNQTFTSNVTQLTTAIMQLIIANFIQSRRIHLLNINIFRNITKSYQSNSCNCNDELDFKISSNPSNENSSTLTLLTITAFFTKRLLCIE